jgi:hypothetical protein
VSQPLPLRQNELRKLTFPQQLNVASNLELKAYVIRRLHWVRLWHFNFDKLFQYAQFLKIQDHPIDSGIMDTQQLFHNSKKTC